MIYGTINLIGEFIFVAALLVFWHIINEARDWWRSTREMEQLEKYIDAENASAERRAHSQALLDNATNDGRESDEGSSMGSSPRGRAAPLALRAESLPQRTSTPTLPAR
jgi:hypothetical protein